METRIRIILNADDFGLAPGIDAAILELLQRGRLSGVSCITNLACGISPTKLDHAEVLETTARVTARFEQLVTEFVRRL